MYSFLVVLYAPVFKRKVFVALLFGKPTHRIWSVRIMWGVLVGTKIVVRLDQRKVHRGSRAIVCIMLFYLHSLSNCV